MRVSGAAAATIQFDKLNQAIFIICTVKVIINNNNNKKFNLRNSSDLVILTLRKKIYSNAATAVGAKMDDGFQRMRIASSSDPSTPIIH